MTTTNQTQWSDYLTEIVKEEGILSACYSVFHNYSYGNQILAYYQLKAYDLPLSPIASFGTWNKLGRKVKKGSKALELLQPILIEEKDEAGNKTGKKFKIFKAKKNWFSLDQTEGDEFKPEVNIPEWRAENALKNLDIEEVRFNSTEGNCQGYAFDRKIAINPIAAYPYKTRFHELAHIVLGHTAEGSAFSDSEITPKDIKEVEAESVAYILCKSLGLDGATESRGYIQHWFKGDVIPEKSAKKIFAAADKILKAGKDGA